MTASSANDSQINRTTVVVALGLAVAFVVAVLGGARYFVTKAAHQPVAMSQLDSPLADSSECSALIDALPSSLNGHRRAELAAPAPAGAAAWQSSSTERITLRCGVHMPAQYNEYSAPLTFDAAGARWLRVDDATPGSTLSTWFSVDREPAVAVTADEASLGTAATPLDDLDLSALPQKTQPPAPAPLSQLAAASGAGAASAHTCRALVDAAPESIAEGYRRLDATSADAAHTVAWIAEGKEPIVVRCGVAAPESYAAGAQLSQVNDVPWFEDTTLANGTTTSTWYALGRVTDVAASLPQSVGNEAVTNLSTLIADTLPER